MPQYVKAQISRELDRLEPLLEQIKAVEKERDTVLIAPAPGAAVNPGSEAVCDKPRASAVAVSCSRCELLMQMSIG